MYSPVPIPVRIEFVMHGCHNIPAVYTEASLRTKHFLASFVCTRRNDPGRPAHRVRLTWLAVAIGWGRVMHALEIQPPYIA